MVEADLVEALQELGPISSVAVMPKKRQVLVEFEDVLGVGGRELRSQQPDLSAGMRSFCQLFYPLENIPPPGLRGLSKRQQWASLYHPEPHLFDYQGPSLYYL